MKKIQPAIKSLVYIWAISLLTILLLMLVFFPSRQGTINNIIQAITVVTLALVTWFYAVQTKSLVDEERASLNETKKRTQVDFLERRINEFYHPFFMRLVEITKMLDQRVLDGDARKKMLLDFKSLINNKTYMTAIEPNIFVDLAQKIETAMKYGSSNVKKELDDFYMAKERLLILLLSEWRNIEAEITRFYSIIQLPTRGDEAGPGDPGPVA